MTRTTSRAVPVLLALALVAPVPLLAQSGPANRSDSGSGAGSGSAGSSGQSQGTATTPESRPTTLPGTGGTNITPSTRGEVGGGGAPRNDPRSSSTPSETSTGTGALRGGADVTTGGSAANR